MKKKTKNPVKTYFIVSLVIILAFLLIITIPLIFKKNLSYEKALNLVFGKDVSVYKTKAVNLPEKPDIGASFDTIVNKNNTFLGKTTVITIKHLSLKNKNNEIKLLVALDSNGKILKILPMNEILTSSNVNWDSFFKNFEGKDYKDLLAKPVPLPVEEGEVSVLIRDKIKEVAALSYIDNYGVTAYKSLKSNEEEKHKILRTGDKLPEFETVDIDGNKIKSKDLAGKKLIIVSTNATCGSCIRHTHEFDDILSRYIKKGKVNYLFISVTSKDKTLEEYGDSKNIDYMRIVIDTKRELVKKLTMEFTPRVMFVDPDGTIMFHGSPTFKNIEEKLKEFLGL